MKKILIIEDDFDIARIYNEKLQLFGYKISVAADGKQGLFLAKSEKPDLILLDIMLPEGMNGFDVLERLKKDEELKGVPVIMLTNLDSEKKVATEMGIVDYLIKANTNLGVLVDKVKSVLG